MPVKPKKTLNRRSDLNPNILTEARYENLTSFMDTVLNPHIFLSLEDKKRCYRVNKKEILERWFTDPINFCERPLCFWEFEDLPPREIVGEEKWWNPIDHNPAEWEISPIKEKDHQYLFRLGLLKECEMERYHELETEIHSIPNLDGNGGIEISNSGKG